MKPGSAVETASSPGVLRGTGLSAVIKEGHKATGLDIAGCAGRCRAMGRARDVGGQLRHPQRLMHGGSGPVLPSVAQGRGQGLARRQRVAQVGQGGQARAQHLAKDAGGGGEDGGLRPRQKRGQGGGRRSGSGDQGGGADGPGVQKAGAKRVGPVQRARVEKAVVRRQPFPVRRASPGAGKDGAMGMGHGHRVCPKCLR